MTEHFENIKKDLQEYIEVRMDLIRLHTAENVAKILSSATTLFVVGYLMFFILLFLSFALGFYLGKVTNSTELGFLLVALLYFLILCIFIALRKRLIETPIIKAIVQLFFPKFTDDENR